MLLEGSPRHPARVDHGTYPYVTSSNPTAGGAAVGSRYRPDPHRRTACWGFSKAYHSGDSGPFPTELFDGRRIPVKTGREFGVTTGRRCGWFGMPSCPLRRPGAGITDYF